jgi:anti-anti-sigma regulatory factor
MPRTPASSSPVDAHQVRVVREDDDLRTSLGALSQLTNSQLALMEVLRRVAQSAVQAIPGADGAGVTLLQAGQAETVVASTPFVAEVDSIQYRINEGPCITSTTRARTVRSGRLEADPQWPHFGPRIEHLGVHSALSIPLHTPEGVLGAMTVYAYATDAFDSRGARIGEQFAVPAAIAVENARVLVKARLLATALQTGLANQAAIDQATGVLMSCLGCSAEQALEHLRQTTQSADEALHTVAARIVHDAVSAPANRGGQAAAVRSGRPDLTVSLGQRDSTHAVLTAGGILSSGTADLLTKVLKHHLESGHRYVHLDVSGLLSCDRDGASAVVAAHHAFVAARGTLVLAGARPPFLQLLRLMDADTVLFLARTRRGTAGRWPT